MEPAPSEAAAAEDAAPLQVLEQRVIAYWLVVGVFGALVLAGMAWAGLLFAHNARWEHTDLLQWALVALVGLRLLWALLAPTLAYNRWRYRVDPELLLMRYGIFFHEERLVPVRRMQHVDLTRGPIERLFGLATLVVYTAGNEGSAFRVPGLSATTAQALRDRILASRGDDVL